jgi:hypothetical protein
VPSSPSPSSAAAALRASQGPTRGAEDPRYRPRGRWNPFGEDGPFGGGAGQPFGRGFGAAGTGSAEPDEAPPMTARAVLTRAQLAEVRDALSGAGLDADAENFRCARCQSYYSVASVRALANENGARCISCRSIHRIPVEVSG